MKIGSQSQTLVSLNSLLDASRQQQQTQREDFQEKKLAETRESRITTRQNERDALIQQNRDALKKIQDDIRLKNLQKLQNGDSIEDEGQSSPNLNLRESIYPSQKVNNKPAFEKLGQILDIRI
ncbi:MAG: hypothetical protein KDF58_04020 [Alphaproteobacteria bacterium]|nr:hypothetical protein [Alphaproteobacteria bacterium]HPF47049.1 hypothetical protein [Emcibacteraceae bacterium]